MASGMRFLLPMALFFAGSRLSCGFAEGENLAEVPDSPPALKSDELIQREIDRRKEMELRLQDTLELADRLYQSGEWEHAEAKYDLILQGSDPQGQASGIFKRARIGKARCLAALALAKEEEGKLSEAGGLLKEAVELDPTNKALARKAADLQEAGSRQADPYQGNPAVTDDLIRRTSEIKKLLSLANQQSETGQFMEARKTLDDVLRMDPYNRVARQKIEALEQKRILAADKRYLASREKALAQVTEAWSPPPPAKVDSAQGRKTAAASRSQAAEILKKLQSIRIRELTFNERPIRQAVEELERLSEQSDPEKKGINFVLRLPPAGAAGNPEEATVTFELRDVSLQTAIKYVCEQIRGGEKLRSEVEDTAVLLLPATETGGFLETRSFNLPPSLIAGLPIAPNQGKPEEILRDDPVDLGKKILKSIGVNTDLEGASVVCFRDTGKMVARNTPAELNKIDQRIRDSEGEKPQKQFEVETKFLQFSDNDVKNFTFNLSMVMNQNNLIPGAGDYNPGVPGAIYTPNATGGTDGLRGTAGLNQSGASVVALQSLLDPTFPQSASNQIGVNAQVLGRGISAILQLLQNAIGKDLVAAPRVTLADGKESKIIISRQMFYPTSYTSPTVPNNDQGVGAGFILPTNPTGFESRDVGVSLTVKGESTSIPKAVDLDFTKLEVEDFEGFVNYGALISSVSLGASPYISGAAGVTPPAQTIIGSAPYLVPIFSKRSLQSRVRLLDGETVGLGGLISESEQLVDDKVPGLGDMPLVGRLFRSEASQRVKFNLVIFCTVRIVEPDGRLAFPEDETNPEYAQAGSSEMMPSVP